MGVAANDKMLRKMKSNFLLLSQTFTSHSTSIIQLEIQLGQISSHLNVRKKGGLPSDTVAIPRNYAHLIAVATSSGKTLVNYILNLEEDPNDKGLDEHISS